jgi:hypothetical protein
MVEKYGNIFEVSVKCWKIENMEKYWKNIGKTNRNICKMNI